MWVGKNVELGKFQCVCGKIQINSMARRASNKTWKFQILSRQIFNINRPNKRANDERDLNS